MVSIPYNKSLPVLCISSSSSSTTTTLRPNKRSWCDSYSSHQNAEQPRKIQNIGSAFKDARGSLAADLHPHQFLIKRLNESGLPVQAKAFDEVENFFQDPLPEEIDSYCVEVVDAVRQGDIELLRQIYREGRPLKCSNRFGESLLHLACRRQKVDVVDFLVNEAKIDPKVRDDYGRTPLHDACWTPAPNFKLVDMILSRCPDLLYIKDRRGHTPLFYARQSHWKSWIQHLEPRLETLAPRSSALLVRSASILKC